MRWRVESRASSLRSEVNWNCRAKTAKTAHTTRLARIFGAIVTQPCPCRASPMPIAQSANGHLGNRMLAVLRLLIAHCPNRPTANAPRQLARQPIGLAPPKSPNRRNGHARARACVIVRACLSRARVCVCASARACACGCARLPARAPPPPGAGARVTVTGTTRKQFFIFYILATQFIAALPAHPASSIMAP